MGQPRSGVARRRGRNAGHGCKPAAMCDPADVSLAQKTAGAGTTVPRWRNPYRISFGPHDAGPINRPQKNRAPRSPAVSGERLKQQSAAHRAPARSCTSVLATDYCGSVSIYRLWRLDFLRHHARRNGAAFPDVHALRHSGANESDLMQVRIVCCHMNSTPAC